MYTFENEKELKEKFAKLLFKNSENPFQVACQLFPEDTSKALWIASHWPADEIVLDAQAAFLLDDGMDVLPGKAELANEIWKKMQACLCADDYAKLAKLYAEVRGFIEKPSPSTNINFNTLKVMEVPVYQTMETWEQQAATQQKELLGVSRSKH